MLFAAAVTTSTMPSSSSSSFHIPGNVAANFPPFLFMAEDSALPTPTSLLSWYLPTSASSGCIPTHFNNGHPNSTPSMGWSMTHKSTMKSDSVPQGNPIPSSSPCPRRSRETYSGGSSKAVFNFREGFITCVVIVTPAPSTVFTIPYKIALLSAP